MLIIRFVIELLSEKASLQPPVGAAVRWAINADGEGGLSLLLQALPATAASLNSRPTFKRDICPGVVLLNILLSVDIDYNGALTGPKPRLFSTSIETTAKVLSSSKSSRHNTGNVISLLFIQKQNTLRSHLIHKIKISNIVISFNHNMSNSVL